MSKTVILKIGWHKLLLYKKNCTCFPLHKQRRFTNNVTICPKITRVHQFTHALVLCSHLQAREMGSFYSWSLCLCNISWTCKHRHLHLRVYRVCKPAQVKDRMSVGRCASQTNHLREIDSWGFTLSCNYRLARIKKSVQCTAKLRLSLLGRFTAEKKHKNQSVSSCTVRIIICMRLCSWSSPWTSSRLQSLW
jgi:hypothetical protein